MRILKKRLADVTREICENLYNQDGANKVYDYANKIKLDYGVCDQCEAETPTIADSKHITCAICGSGKEVHAIERNGKEYQTVFPEKESEKSQLHPSLKDAKNYFKELGVKDFVVSIQLLIFVI